MPRPIPLALALALTAASALAQPRAPAGAPPRTGDRVRARVVGPAGAGSPVGRLCETRLAAVAGDTLVAADRGCPRGAYLANVEVYRGERGERGTHAVVGAVAGGLLAGGGVLRAARAAGGGGDEGGMPGFALAVMVGGVGALVGAVAGASVPAGPQWAPAGAARPVRVAGLALRPGVRVAVAPRGQLAGFVSRLPAEHALTAFERADRTAARPIRATGRRIR
jgi:hypothetical protein